MAKKTVKPQSRVRQKNAKLRLVAQISAQKTGDKLLQNKNGVRTILLPWFKDNVQTANATAKRMATNVATVSRVTGRGKCRDGNSLQPNPSTNRQPTSNFSTALDSDHSRAPKASAIGSGSDYFFFFLAVSKLGAFGTGWNLDYF